MYNVLNPPSAVGAATATSVVASQQHQYNNDHHYHNNNSSNVNNSNPQPSQLQRRTSRSNSVSSSSKSTIKRSASLSSTSGPPHIPLGHRPSDSIAESTAAKSYKKGSVSSRRRSSVALDGINGLREGIGNLNRWSQSTTSSKASSGKEATRANFSRRLSIANGTSSPSRLITTRPSPPSSPLRRRPSSPAYSPLTTLTALPPIDPLPILAATVYDPKAPFSTTTTTSSSSATTPLSQMTSNSTDYFGSKPRPGLPAGSSAGRSSPARTWNSGEQQQQQQVQHQQTNSKDSATRLTSHPGPAATASGATTNRPARVDSRQGFGSVDLGPHQHRRIESNASDLGLRQHNRDCSDGQRTRVKREKDKKTMLSRALQKANTAVLLDNASNFEGAIEAYSDACSLLQQVMIRSSGEDDRRKLEAIRVTYTNRIEELKVLDQVTNHAHSNSKSLPARPMSNESFDADTRSMLLDANLEDDEGDEEPAVIEVATVTRIVNDRSMDSEPDRSSPVQRDTIPPAILAPETGLLDDMSTTFLLQNSPLPEPEPDRLFGLESPMDRKYLPPPLSPRRIPSPAAAQGGESNSNNNNNSNNAEASFLRPIWEGSSGGTHSRGDSSESISWLDVKDDDSVGSSCSSSVHSISLHTGIRRKHLHTGGNAIEAEFDAAFDAAVEAAYDDGFEPYDDEDEEVFQQSEHVPNALRNVSQSKEEAQLMEREEMIAATKRREVESRSKGEILPHVRESFDFDYNAEEVEEEERILEEMRKDYLLDDFDFGLQTKSALPRESDSSGFSSNTWASSLSSSKRTTGGLSLTTVTESATESSSSTAPFLQGPPSKPPPPSPLPSIADEATPRATQPSQAGVPPLPHLQGGSIPQGVRDRRLSGQNPKQLTIATSIAIPPGQAAAPLTQQPLVAPKESMPPLPKSAIPASFNTTQEPPQLTASIARPNSAAGSSMLPALTSAGDTATTISLATPSVTQLAAADATHIPASPISGPGKPVAQLRKNTSQLSLKNRNLSVSSPDGSEGSLGTPLSSTFTTFPSGRKPSIGNIVQTPLLPSFSGSEALPTGGMHLFESDIHSPYSPGSPNPMAINAPIPLEPCPDSYLLRPFWLMRCFYQTIAHPRGGYLSTKLFIPRDVWRVKGVKIKVMEEKISNCDLLTAALLKLATVDSNDADAVLEEMQALEFVLDQVQSNLVKKLGNEVGVHGVQTLFKDASGVGNGGGFDVPQEPQAKSGASQSKSYLTSWRKLRSKNSAVGLANMTGPAHEVTKASLTMSTLPMTTLPNIRFAKRDISQVEFSGPNANYMSALARLFDAAQIVDQIARQVEDPGLKLSSPTHVGLELSTRHAAEFFGFYVCRFVLTDLTTMLDKFIKRGSEWVLV